MGDKGRLHDEVALTGDVPDKRLFRGQVGTVVEKLADGVFEVEFSDEDGKAYAFAQLRPSQFMILRYEPAAT